MQSQWARDQRPKTRKVQAQVERLCSGRINRQIEPACAGEPHRFTSLRVLQIQKHTSRPRPALPIRGVRCCRSFPRFRKILQRISSSRDGSPEPLPRRGHGPPAEPPPRRVGSPPVKSAAPPPVAPASCRVSETRINGSSSTPPRVSNPQRQSRE